MGPSRMRSALLFAAILTTAVVATWCLTGNQTTSLPITQWQDRHWSQADISAALLCDYYEHNLEHAPPRDPSGAMQCREHYYHSPPDPITYVTSRITTSAADVRLARDLQVLQTTWMAGEQRSASRIQSLEKEAEESSLEAVALLEIARGMNFLAGDEMAGIFFRAALAKAGRTYVAMASGDPSAKPLLIELDQTKALYRLKDYPTLEMRFRLARRLNAPLSVESRRAGCLLADAIYYQNRFADAADVILDVQREDERVGDLGALDRSDNYEMEYLQGYLLYCADRFEQAIAHLQRVRGGGHDQAAAQALFSALLKTGRFEQAKACLLDATARLELPLWAQTSMSREFEQAIQLQQWRQNVASAN